MINKFVTFEDVEEIRDEKVLIIDGYNIAYITVHNAIKEDYSDNGVFDLWKQKFLGKIFGLIMEIKPTKVVLAFDSKNSWRYGVYSEYKAQRKTAKPSKFPLNKEKFNEVLDEMVQTIKDIFPIFYTIRSPHCEGDDIIAILTKYKFNKPNYKIVVVSTDKDFWQLMVNKNVSQYDPMKNKFFSILNPKQELQIKVLSGDTSDNIKPIKYGVGPKKAIKILNMEHGIDSFLMEQSTDLERKIVEENYKRNRQLVDFGLIPLHIKNQILDEYNSYKYEQISVKTVFNWFIKNKMHDLRNKWQVLSEELKKLR